MSERHQKSDEADKYTTSMWQHFIGRMVNVAIGSEAQKRGFRDGFNGEERPHHHAVRASFDVGRHAAILLGYIKDRP